MREVEDRAPYWAVRLNGATLSQSEQNELEAWLGMDERNAGALLRAEAALSLVDRAQALGPVMLDEVQTASTKISRRSLLNIGLAGSTALAAGAAGIVLLPRGDAITTRVGEMRRTQLADNSRVTVNTNSRLLVKLDKSERRIRLDRGEAWFEVAHDRERPFTVSAGELSVRAIGTAFSVRRFSNGADILVTEGVVEAWRPDRDSRKVRIASGHRTFVPDDASTIVAVRANKEIERALAWRTGGLALDGEPLDYAVAEMNRYNRRQVLIDDPVVGRTAIVGYFRLDDPARFARSVGELVGAMVEYDGDNYRLALRSS